MSKRKLFNEYKSGDDFVRAAQKSDNVVAIRHGKGDHVVIQAKDGTHITVPMHKEISTGLRWKLIKLFIRAGIIIAIVVYILSHF